MLSELFGDPELPMWLEKLGPLAVEYPHEISGTGQIFIEVKDSDGLPVEEARVCIQKGDWQTGEIYEVGYTDGNGEVVLEIDPVTLGEAVLTVSALNHDPFQSQIPVVSVEYSQGDLPMLVLTSNPAIEPVEMNFSVPENSNIEILIFDIAGRVVSVPVSGDYQTGTYSLTLAPLNTGIYFARLTSGMITLTENFTVLD